MIILKILATLFVVLMLLADIGHEAASGGQYAPTVWQRLLLWSLAIVNLWMVWG